MREEASSDLREQRQVSQRSPAEGGLVELRPQITASAELDAVMVPLKVVVVIPCLNEEPTIEYVVRHVPRRLPGIHSVKVLVIDDGSQDNTYHVAVGAGADRVLQHKATLGLGQSVKEGLRVSLGLGADIIVTMDGDGQHDPAEIPRLLEPIIAGRADLVVGSRQIAELRQMSWSKRWGNRLASWLTRRLSGVQVRDAQSGFRALSREAAMRLTLDGGYTYTQEMIIQAAHRGLAVRDVPITYHPRSHGSSRLIGSIWRYAIRSGSIILRTYRDHNPLKVFVTIGGVTLAAGVAFGLRVLVHFFNTGMVTPLLPSAILAAVLGVMGFQVIISGLLADMMRTHRKLTEEVLRSLRENGITGNREK